MEWNEYFSVFILSVIVIHMAATIGVNLQRWWQESNVSKHPELFARDADSDGFSTKKPEKQRSDWYAFFHCSDLVGKEPTVKNGTSLSQEEVVSQPQRRPTVRRPENRLTLT